MAYKNHSQQPSYVSFFLPPLKLNWFEMRIEGNVIAGRLFTVGKMYGTVTNDWDGDALWFHSSTLNVKWNNGCEWKCWRSALGMGGFSHSPNCKKKKKQCSRILILNIEKKETERFSVPNNRWLLSPTEHLLNTRLKVKDPQTRMMWRCLWKCHFVREISENYSLMPLFPHSWTVEEVTDGKVLNMSF